MPDSKFNLGDYVEVKERIRIFYEMYGKGSIVTTDVQLTSEPDGVPRVLVEAKAYRTPDDPQPGVGWSWMVLPGTTSYTRGSELENTETSAWGRAIASLGILVDRSIASAQEVQNKQDDGKAPPKPKSIYDADRDAGGLVGMVAESKESPDFLPTIGPDGYVLVFKLVRDGDSARGGIKAIAKGSLAEQLADMGKELKGVMVTAFGRISDESFTNKAGRDIAYQVLQLERVKVGTLMLPREVSPLREDPEPLLDDEGEERGIAIPVAEGQVPAFKLDPEERLLIGGEDA